MAFEELGPTFIKLGQILAGRPDIIPPEMAEEFRLLQHRVQPIAFSEISKILDRQYGDFRQVFAAVDDRPLASASIAQVHLAQLKDGTEVVVKVQKPGVKESIAKDIDVLYFLAELFERHIEESHIFRPTETVREFERALKLETNFAVEANNIRRFAENFDQDEHVRIPKVYTDLTSTEILVMEYFSGPTLSESSWEEVPGLNKHELLEAGTRAYLEMVFVHGFFHGDLHSGNLIVLPNNQIGLIDFGAVGRLSRRTQGKVVSMFLSLAREDYESLAQDYLDLAPFDERTHPEDFARDLRGLIAPFFGLTSRNVNIGHMLMSSSSLAAQHHVALPSDLLLFFRSLMTVEGMGKRILDDFDLLPQILEFSKGLIKVRYEPQKVLGDFLSWSKDSGDLLANSPRQLKHFLRKVNHPSYEIKIDIKRVERLRSGVIYGAELLFLGLVIMGLLIGGSSVSSGLVGSSLPSYTPIVFFSSAAFLMLVAIFNYIKK